MQFLVRYSLLVILCTETYAYTYYPLASPGMLRASSHCKRRDQSSTAGQVDCCDMALHTQSLSVTGDRHNSSIAYRFIGKTFAIQYTSRLLSVFTCLDVRYSSIHTATYSNQEYSCGDAGAMNFIFYFFTNGQGLSLTLIGAYSGDTSNARISIQRAYNTTSL